MNPKLYNATLDLVRSLHGDQVRKYTGEPYWMHCEAVARNVAKHGGDPMMIAAALCHDVIEDAGQDFNRLWDRLEQVGWSAREAHDIADLVDDLSDQYTTEAYPNMNRAWRKKKEAERLARTSREVQTIKYADLIDNTMSIATHDPKFAQVYLKEKAALLDLMQDGDGALRAIATQVLRGAIRKARVSGVRIPGAENKKGAARSTENTSDQHCGEIDIYATLDRTRAAWLATFGKGSI